MGRTSALNLLPFDETYLTGINVCKCLIVLRFALAGL